MTDINKDKIDDEAPPSSECRTRVVIVVASVLVLILVAICAWLWYRERHTKLAADAHAQQTWAYIDCADSFHKLNNLVRKDNPVDSVRELSDFNRQCLEGTAIGRELSKVDTMGMSEANEWALKKNFARGISETRPTNVLKHLLPDKAATA